jgi:hypothetical protein
MRQRLTGCDGASIVRSRPSVLCTEFFQLERPPVERRRHLKSLLRLKNLFRLFFTIRRLTLHQSKFHFVLPRTQFQCIGWFAFEIRAATFPLHRRKHQLVVQSFIHSQNEKRSTTRRHEQHNCKLPTSTCKSTAKPSTATTTNSVVLLVINSTLTAKNISTLWHLYFPTASTFAPIRPFRASMSTSA